MKELTNGPAKAAKHRLAMGITIVFVFLLAILVTMFLVAAILVS